MRQFFRSHTTWTPRRRRGAAVQLVLGGLFLMGFPALLGESAVAAGFRMLAPVAWLMAVAGSVLMLWPAEPRSRTQARPEPSGLVPLQTATPRSRARAGTASRTSVATAAKPAAVPTPPAAERFRDTELQFEDPDARR
jgi:hypothetical protein